MTVPRLQGREILARRSFHRQLSRSFLVISLNCPRENRPSNGARSSVHCLAADVSWDEVLKDENAVSEIRVRFRISGGEWR